MMNSYIACCGLDCEKCEARLATINNDNILREKVAKEWSELNKVEITPQMINCTGCRIEGPKTPFCQSLCPIRRCAQGNGFATCGECNKIEHCETLSMITSHNNQALNNLKSK